VTGHRLLVAAVQARPAFLDLGATLDLLEQWAERARATGARIIAFPETWLPGYPVWLDSSPNAAVWGDAAARALFLRLFDNAVTIPGPAVERLGRTARRLGATLVVGLHERSGRTLYNTMLTVGPDGVVRNRHRKLMPTYSERLIWGLGDASGLRACEVEGVQLGGLVCWEHWMPLARQAMHDSGEVIHVAQWPGVQEMHQVASRHYAFEGRCFVVAAGSLLRVGDLPPDLPLAERYAGPPEKLLIRVGSAIIAPNGRYLAGPVFDEETVVSAACDLSEVVGESLTLDVSGHYRRPDVFELTVHRGPDPSRPDS
jgi:predicted amidohydrolase